jgi:endonuclease III
MKNATKHAEELKSLHKRLTKEFKPAAREPVDPLKSLVRGAMSFDVTDTRADEAMKLIDKEFVDLNELRVATELEVQEMLGQRYPAIERRVAMITAALNKIFEREHTLSLDRLKTLTKRDARQFLRDLPEIHPFVEAYVMLYAFDGHAVPVDEEMLVVLRDHRVVDATTTVEDAQKFVEHNIKAEDCHEFFSAVRHHLSDKAKKKK